MFYLIFMCAGGPKAHVKFSKLDPRGFIGGFDRLRIAERGMILRVYELLQGGQPLGGRVLLSRAGRRKTPMFSGHTEL